MTFKAEIMADMTSQPLLKTEDFTDIHLAREWINRNLQQYITKDSDIYWSQPIIPFIRGSASITDLSGKITANQFGLISEYGKP